MKKDKLLGEDDTKHFLNFESSRQDIESLANKILNINAEI